MVFKLIQTHFCCADTKNFSNKTAYFMSFMKMIKQSNNRMEI